MAGPTNLILEPEPNEALFVRKLVVETAKFNLTTAYSAQEGRELLSRFPRIDCLVKIANMKGCEETARKAKSVDPALPIILLSAHQNYRCDEAEHHLSSHEPEQLSLLQVPSVIRVSM